MVQGDNRRDERLELMLNSKAVPTTQLDLIPELLTEQEIEELNRQIQSASSCCLPKDLSALECSLILTMDAVGLRDYSGSAEAHVNENLLNTDFLSLYTDFMNALDNESESFMVEGFINLANNPEYLQRCQIAMSLNSLESDLFCDLISKMTWDHTDRIRFSGLIDANRFKTLVIYANYAWTTDLYESPTPGDASSSIIKFRAVSKVFEAYPKAKEAYIIWRDTSLSGDDRVRVLLSLLNSEVPHSVVAESFFSYWVLSGDDKGWFIFDWNLSECVRTPVFEFKFKNLLKEHKYRKEYCEQYNAYCNLNNIEVPMLDVSSIVFPTSPYAPGKFRVNTSLYDISFGSDELSTLKVCFSNLFQLVHNEGHITDVSMEATFVDIFIYPDKSTAEIIPWVKDPTLLANFVRILYKTPEGDVPYGIFATMEKHFGGVKKLNILANQNNAKPGGDNLMEKAILMLEKSGFQNARRLW